MRISNKCNLGSLDFGRLFSSYIYYVTTAHATQPTTARPLDS